jgi:hypothetical protein
MACPIAQIPTPIEEETPNLDALPIEVVARHEAGHALAAHRCGGRAKRIVFGTTASGHPYGRASWVIPPDDHKYLLVLSAGPLALFLHDCPSVCTFWEFNAWMDTDEGFLRAASGAADWREILRRTNQPEGHGLYDFLVRAIGPYFDETCQLLANSRDQLDALTPSARSPAGSWTSCAQALLRWQATQPVGHALRSNGGSLGIGRGETRCRYRRLALFLIAFVQINVGNQIKTSERSFNEQQIEAGPPVIRCERRAEVV